MGFLKLIFQLVLVTIIIVSVVAVYFSSQKKQFSTVDLNSYVENDITGTGPAASLSKVKPVTEQEIIDLITATSGPVTVSGVHHSLGGQITYEHSLFLDLSDFDEVLEFDTEKKLITVQSGISWSQIQQVIDPHNLSIKIMQDHNDYTVGGSLSVNAHGRYVSDGSIINSVKSIRIVLPNGQIYDASPDQNSALFYGAIGGFGGVGVIVQATLELVDNIPLERSIKTLSFNEFNNYFKGNVLNDDSVVLHQAILYPPNFESLLNISWKKTDKPLTDDRRLQENLDEPWWESLLLTLRAKSTLLHRFQKNLFDPYLYGDEAVVTRNLETSSSLRHAGFIASDDSTMAMQEYLIPVNRFEIFVFNLRDIFSRHKADIFKILISYLPQDHGGLLAGSTAHVYTFKIIYLQGKNQQSHDQVESWTNELVRASTESNGVHILPYYVHDSTQQLYNAYPSSGKFFELKKNVDPNDRFRNLFWEQHHQAVYAGAQRQLNVPVNSFDQE
jgi:hypothetical protein